MKCQKLFDIRFKQIMKNQKMSHDFRENRTYIEARMLVNNIVITIKIFFYTILILYFTGTYWLCCSLIFYTWSGYENVDDYFVYSELN